MNYYDEEIKLDGMGLVKLDKVQSESKKPTRASARTSATLRRGLRSAKQEGLARTSSSHVTDDDDDEEHLDNVKSIADSDDSESESNDSKEYPENQALTSRLLSPSNWERLAVPQEIKDIFPCIVKYTPQHIENDYHLQPFVPEYVPAVGDVDAFLKVSLPSVIDPRRGRELYDHLNKMGLHFLDEPSGQQSEPSLMSIKLGSVLSGSAKTPSAAQAPVAKSGKDIDKWINEVEQVHIGQSGFNVQPEKDIEGMMLNWPQSYAAAEPDLRKAFQDENISLIEYIRVLCEKLDIECGAPDELTQAQCIQKVYTLFSMYLAANHSYD